MMRKRLIEDYFKRAKIRFKVLNEYLKEGDYADVVRESQEIVELLLKAIIMYAGLDVPKTHEPSRFIKENLEFFPLVIKENINRIVEISRELRKDRELSFYGADDWIPSEEYKKEDAKKTIEKVKFIIDIAEKVLK